MNTSRKFIKHSTLWITLVALLSLFLTLWYFFSRQPVSYAGGTDVLSSPSTPKQTVSGWNDVAEKALDALSKNNNDEAIAVLTTFKSQLLSMRVSADMTSTHLNRVLGIENLIEKIKSHQSRDAIEKSLRTLINHF